jgi:hypothetical protein
MKKNLFFPSLLSLLLIGITATAQETDGTGCVSGTVTDETGRGIAGAVVTLKPEAYYLPEVSGETNDDGQYRISVEAGNARHFASIKAPGHTLLDDVIPLIPADNPVRDFTLYGTMTYRGGERSTIILPFAPDPTVGRYYTLDRLDGKKVIFRRVMEPQANQPYVLFADRDYHVSLEGYDLSAVTPGSINLGWVSFFGIYNNGLVDFASPMTPDILDEKEDWVTDDPLESMAMHALLLVYWELWYERELVFDDTPNDVTGVKKQPRTQHTALNPFYDLQGRRLNGKSAACGLYIRGGKKVLITK